MDRASSRAGRTKQLAFAEFVRAHPGYPETSALDDLRAREFSRLDRLDQVYVDYAGSGLYAESQVRRHADLLVTHVFGNPHSLSPTSSASTDALERCRRRVLRFFEADPDEYAVVFTANASQALKLVGEAYAFEPGDHFLLTFDNHNSVNGIREFARSRGAKTHYIPVLPPDLRAADEAVEAALTRLGSAAHRRLFAFPAQSNFSGVQHPLAWIDRAHQHGWDVILDAAAFAPTNRLDLSRSKPEWVSISFYKMFGYPTGVGALLARRDALPRLRRPWFAGGTIHVASVQADQFRRADGAAAFEDGTPDFLAMPAIEFGLDLLETVGMNVVHARVRTLTAWLIDELLGLRHGNGTRAVRLYGPASTDHRGGTVAFNLATPDGSPIDHDVVHQRAALERISLRTGCFCNPGAGEVAFDLSRGEIAGCLARSPERMTHEDFRHCIDPKAAGAIRVSLGLASNFDDVWRLVRFLQGFVSL